MENYFISFIENSIIVHQRLFYLVNIPPSFRTLNLIFKGFEDNVSDLYTDRTTEYINIIRDEIGTLKSLSLKIEQLDHPYSNEHKKLLNEKFIQLIERVSDAASNNTIYYMNYTLFFAINQYIARGTQLEKYSPDIIKKGYQFADEDFSIAFIRYTDTMIDNGKATLMYYTIKLKQMLIEESKDKRKSQERNVIIVLIIDPIITLVPLISFIPIILRIQTYLLKIYIYLCKLKENDVKNWLDTCYEASNDIKGSIEQIIKSYKDTNFNITNKKAIEKNSCKVAIVNLKRDPENLESEQDQTEAPLVSGVTEKDVLIESKEDMEKRKQEIFSVITRERTKHYFMYLMIFVVYIAAVEIINIVQYIKHCNKTDKQLSIMLLLSERIESNILGFFFLREELANNEVAEFFDGISSFNNS